MNNEYLIIASFNDLPFNNPTYILNSDKIDKGSWQETFNSDDITFGGEGIGNADTTIFSQAGTIEIVVPANGLLALKRTG